jgi:mannose-1-phosphate guanylyltransferase
MSTMQDVYAVIMAGGSGTRFWPLSRRAWPKQFLSLASSAELNESLLQATVRRIRGLVPSERILVVTSERHAEATRRQLPDLPPENVLAEPAARNTAPCVAWAAAHVSARAPKAVMMVLPADPHIGDEAAYRALLTRACDAAAQGGLVTIGVTPTRPETGYGYIECGAETESGSGVNKVQRFVEKPDAARAQEFVRDKRFLWNSGMFFFRADKVLEEYQKQLPDLYAFATGYREQASSSTAHSFVIARYGELTSISIDHGIMERAADVRVVPGAFGWYDIGSWTTAWELAQKDEQGNAVLAEASMVDSKNCYVRANAGKLVALIGVEDLVVVDTEDALLIMPRERAQDVRRVVEDLTKRDAKKHL